MRGGVGVGVAPGKSLPCSCRPTASASVDVVSPSWRRRRGVHPLHILGSSSSGESLRPSRVGRRRRHRRFLLWGVALKSIGSRLHFPWAGRSRHCGRRLSVRQCGCCATSSVATMAASSEVGRLLSFGSRSHPACSRGCRASFVFLKSELQRRCFRGDDDTRRVVGSGAGSAQAQRFSPAMLVDRVEAAWSPARVVDCLASADASLDASPRRRVCILVWVARSSCVPCFRGHDVTVFGWFSVN